MNIMLVSATETEIAPFFTFLENSAKKLSSNYFIYNRLHIQIIITGPGIMNTTFALCTSLQGQNTDLIINVGIAGAFNIQVPKGAVFTIDKDRFADFGTENADASFTDIFSMGLQDKNEAPYSDGWIELTEELPEHLHLLKGKGVTVNKVTGTIRSAEELINLYQPDTESMEGAAFAFVAAKLHIKSLQIRAISNHVEARNRANWDLPLAISNLNTKLLQIIDYLGEKRV